MKPSCYIFSPDGFDIDVLWNTKRLYERVGFSVYFGAAPFSCNVLVILRGKPAELAAFVCPAVDEVHLFDYAGQDTAAFANQLRDRRVLSIAASEAAYARAKVTHGEVLISGPYVDVEHWIYRRPVPRRDGCCHIGNYKKQSAGDLYLERMTAFIRENDVAVWGAGWEGYLPEQRYHGHAYLNDVGRIYARYRFALGIMHPFQREVTYSSRFWFGPLNGCAILSEPGRFVGPVPGVLETDFSPADVRRVTGGAPEVTAIAAASRQYWQGVSDRLAEALARRAPGKPVRVGWQAGWQARLRGLTYWHGKEIYRRFFGRRR